MQRQTIAIDIDDVIADSTEALRVLVNQRMGSSLTREDYRKDGEYWGYYERVWHEHGLADKVDFTELNKEMEIDQSHVPFLPGASFAISELGKKYHVILVTARDPAWEAATRVWLKDQFSQDDVDIYFTGHRHSEDYKSKGQLCRELKATYLIDDNPGHCKSAIDEGIEAILFGEYGWHVDIPSKVVKCKDWPSVLEHFNAQRS